MSIWSIKYNYIYLIRVGRYVKIGKATNPVKRIKTMQSGCPEEYDVICIKKTEGASWIEHELHKHFDHKRVRGEWFLLNDEEIREAEELI